MKREKTGKAQVSYVLPVRKYGNNLPQL